MEDAKPLSSKIGLGESSLVPLKLNDKPIAHRQAQSLNREISRC
jgi:hypothetical protein